MSVPRPKISSRLRPHAATEGARTRFRAVMMTSFAFIAGLIPLVTAQGAAELSRRFGDVQHAFDMRLR